MQSLKYIKAINHRFKNTITAWEIYLHSRVQCQIRKQNLGQEHKTKHSIQEATWVQTKISSNYYPVTLCPICSPTFLFFSVYAAAAAAKSLQLCPTLCDSMDCTPPGSSVSGILQARTLEWTAISLPNAGKWKVKVKSLSHAYQAPPSMGFSRQEYWSGVLLPSPDKVTRSVFDLWLLFLTQSSLIPWNILMIGSCFVLMRWWLAGCWIGAGHQKDQAMIGNLEVSALTQPFFQGRGE